MAYLDDFHEIARYYDRIMDHVDYDRWYSVATALTELLPPGFTHLDAACGTGKLLRSLREDGWRSVGVDLSLAMVRSARRQTPEPITALADLRRLPFHESVDYVTCLFDSINFLLTLDDIAQAFREVAGSLREGGLFYFDMVTQKMVTDHFDNQEWTEQTGRFATTWRSSFVRETGVAETEVRVTSGAGGVFLERVYRHEDIEAVLAASGLALLGAYDAHTLQTPRPKTVRIDYVAAKDGSRAFKRRFDSVIARLRRDMY
ncbi:MAG: methyltransferase domain-containing protein [Nitrospiraceae bacterium]|nr:methyltransferase domain-containing protein [Nitrospiraceae bacterium]